MRFFLTAWAFPSPPATFPWTHPFSQGIKGRKRGKGLSVQPERLKLDIGKIPPWKGRRSPGLSFPSPELFKNPWMWPLGHGIPVGMVEIHALDDP